MKCILYDSEGHGRCIGTGTWVNNNVIIDIYIFNSPEGLDMITNIKIDDVDWDVIGYLGEFGGKFRFKVQ